LSQANSRDAVRLGSLNGNVFLRVALNSAGSTTVGAFMGGAKRRKQYLAKAREADKQAIETNDGGNHQAWKAIADSYRALALLDQKRGKVVDLVETNKSLARRK
jgi:hypothetical protein